MSVENSLTKFPFNLSVEDMAWVRQTRERLLRGLFDSYYADVERPVIFDTNRSWNSHLPALMKLFLEAKIICCVRDVAWIMADSLHIYRIPAPVIQHSHS